MGKSKHISAVISLKDNMSAALRDIQKEQKSFQRQVTRTRNQLAAASQQKMKVRLDSTTAHKKIKKLRRELRPLRKKVATAIAVKDLALAKVKRVKRELKGIARFIASPVIKVKDQVTGRLGKIKQGLTSFKGMAIVAGAAAAGKALIGSGMELEQQKLSMEHFMGVGNKDKSKSQVSAMSKNYVKQLRDNANATPFETGEVLGVGARALQISGGNAKEAMKQVKLAEDMAAMNPGKSVSDAMEALAAAKTGEMERLKQFGVRASSKDSFESIQGQLQDKYAGGAEKLSESGAGLLSTITGKLKSGVADIGEGMLEPLKPVMKDMISGLDEFMPKISGIGSVITSGITGVIQFLQSQAPVIQPLISAIGDTFQALLPAISTIFDALKPVFSGFLSLASSVFQGICTVVQTVAPIVAGLMSGLKPVFSAVGTALRAMGSVFNTVFSAVKTVVKGAYDFIKPIIDGIGSAISTVGNAVSTARNFLTGGGGSDHNATGTAYFSGGWTTVGEHGTELMKLPSGTQIYSNTQTRQMLKNEGNTESNIVKTSSNNIVIQKIADKVVISKDVDAEALFSKFLYKLKEVSINTV